MAAEELSAQVDDLTAAKTLLVYAGNVSKDDEKYRKIRIGNEKFVQRVWRHPAARNLLLIMGWSEEDGFLTIPAGTDVSAFVAALEARVAELESSGGLLARSESEQERQAAVDARREAYQKRKQQEELERQRIKDQLAADRRDKALRKARDSHARDVKFGGRVTRFADVGVDLNAGGG